MNNAEIQKVKAAIDSMFANGKVPSEEFGMSWDMLSEMEQKQPSLTCKTHQGRTKRA